jgi:anti-sigma-K factor RskA
MDTELTYSQVSELLPAYVLGALEPEEMLAVDTYLSSNQVLVARLREIELTVVQMAFVAPDAPLPTDAKSRLLARVQASFATSGPLETVTAPQAQSPEIVSGSPLKRNSVSAQTGSWSAWLNRAFRADRWLIATGCVLIVLVALAFYTAQLQGELGQVTARFEVVQREHEQLQIANAGLQQTNESLQRQLLANQSQLQQAGVTLDSLQAEAAELKAVNLQLQQFNQSLQQQVQTNQELLGLITSAERTVFLPGTEESPQASGALYLSAADQAVLVLRGLEPLPADQTYQLWLIPANSPPQPAGLLEVQSGGLSWQPIEIPAEAEDFAAVGVSVEPAGGSPAPSGPIVLLGTVS